MMYRCVVVRKQKWVLDVEASNREDAKDKADAMSAVESPNDDWAYETTAYEIGYETDAAGTYDGR